MTFFENMQEAQKIFIELGKSFSIGFVPTMGALHAGHLSLVEKAKTENDKVVVSIFLNPTQFNNEEDLKKYPTHLEKDLGLLSEVGVDFVLLPSFENIYPENYGYRVHEDKNSKILCGKERPGHFDGVLTIVLKLLMISQAHRAYFGEKDYQQLKLIQGLCRAFFIPTEIIPCPIARDEKGLALSSRNQRLSPQGIESARKFAKLLAQSKPLNEIMQDLKNENIQVEYLQEEWHRRFGAVHVENVRLIDNVPI
ncbi:MAG: pantoate--beta-alanine ligase [Bdellovibrionales bacterium]|nr:pantoate--beta-alanine ligase [Bdellovibrionales bacterium]